jgi:putative DNA primase/helicase
VLHDPTPSFFGVTASDVPYDPDAPPPTQWLAYLRGTVADDEAIGALQEWLGYTLGGDTSQQKILFCIGPKRSGKGTFARIHTALLGRNSVGGPTMSSFGTNFGLAPLITKSLAIISDARIGKRTDRAAVTERLLTISGEDTIDVDRKYGTMWSGRLPTRIAILTNELPAFSEGSGALAGRFLVVMFQHSFFGREDPGLTDRLMTELPGILNWAIEGYERLQARGHFVQPANALEQIEAIERLGNPVKAFVLDRCVVGPAREIDSDDLYNDWRAWCDEHGGEAGNKDWFGRNLRAAVPGITIARLGSTDADGRRRFVYRGVGIESPNTTRPANYRLTQGARRTGAE